MKTLRKALLYALPVAVMVVGLGLLSLTVAQTATPPSDPTLQQPAQQPDSTGSASESKIFTGKIVKAGDKLVLTDAEGTMTYQLDDQKKAKSFLNKNVKVTGTLDSSSGTIRVNGIEPAA
jgi:hypothetical protein